MTILRTDKIAGLDSVSAITGSVFFGNNVFESTTAKTKNFLITNDGNSDLSLGTSDFTVEGWFWTSMAADVTQDYQVVIADSQYSNNYSWSFYIYQDEIKLWTCSTSCSALITGGSISSNTWHHFAWTRTGGTSRVFIDGSSIGSAADTTNYSDDRIMIGANKWSEAKPYGNYGLNNGYISNIRIIKGKAIYGGAFTPPTRQLKVTPETVLLCCQSSQDPTKEETGKILEAHIMDDAPGPVASTFVPDVGNDHTHGTVLEGDVEFTSLNYMTLPRGTTTQSNRGRGLQMGSYLTPGASSNAITYIEIATTGNTKDFGDLTSAQASGAAVASSTRAVYGGGWTSPGVDICYVTIATTANAIDFGADRTQGKGAYAPGSGNSTRGLFWSAQDHPSYYNTIDFVTIATTGACTEFGDINKASGRYGGATFADSTRAVYAGGVTGATPTALNEMDRVQIATQSDGTDFGDLTTAKRYTTGASDSTRGVVYAGGSPSDSTVIEYITIQGGGGSTDFGDATVARAHIAGMSNSIRGVFAGGVNPAQTNVIDSITFQTTGNAVDWGDYVVGIKAGSYSSGTSDSHGGLSE